MYTSNLIGTWMYVLLIHTIKTKMNIKIKNLVNGIRSKEYRKMKTN